MKKFVALLIAVSFVSFFAGCATNENECNEKTFMDVCLDADTLVVCTYGEKAHVLCSDGCEDGDEDDKYEGHAHCAE